MNTVSEEPVILAILLGIVLVRGAAAALVGQTTLKPSLKSTTCVVHLFVYLFICLFVVFKTHPPAVPQVGHL